MRCDEAQELITGLVDSELSGADRSTIEEHLRACPNCQLSYREEQDLKQQLRTAGSYLKAPAPLRQRALAAAQLALAPHPTRIFRHHFFSAARTFWQPAFVAAVLVLFIVPTLYFTRTPAPPISQMVVETYGKIQRGEMQLLSSPNPEQLKEQLVRAVGGAFAPMGYDFSMIDLKPTGAVVREVAGRKMIAVVYQGKGPALICYTFLGTEKDAPPSAGAFLDNEKNMRFYTFTADTINAVMHREGDTICILASTMPAHELLALARAKAKST
ncbi:MAG: anti-sigma factor family protein [Candidatus Binatia bacterium]